MRISDWSSDVCSSDLSQSTAAHDGPLSGGCVRRSAPRLLRHRRQQSKRSFPRCDAPAQRSRDRTLPLRTEAATRLPHQGPIVASDRFLRKCRDRKSVVSGKSVSVRVDLGGLRVIKKKKKNANTAI